MPAIGKTFWRGSIYNAPSPAKLDLVADRWVRSASREFTFE